jgi:acetyl-CoA acetyltransferase family protein
MPSQFTSGRPVAVIDGCRTPFFGQAVEGLTALDLARWVLAAVGHRLPLSRQEVDLVVLGRAGMGPASPDLGRTAVLAAGWPETTPAWSVREGWPAGLTTFLTGAQAVASDRAQVVVIVGTEFFVKPDDPVDPATGLSFGQSAERLAKFFGISRAHQDQYARTSHQRAVTAQKAGRFEPQITPLYLPPDFAPIAKDDTPWPEEDLDRLADLPLVYDPLFGTITEATGPRPAAGAAALVLMSESRCQSLGLEPMGWIRAWAGAAGDPRKEQCLGASLALARLDRPQAKVIELDESFAIQVLASTEFAPQSTKPLEADKVNAWGGSLALGQAAGATGDRLVLNALHRLKAERADSGVVATGSAGAIGQALFLERT